MTTTKTLGGKAAPPVRTISRQVLIDFVTAAGVDPSEAVSLHADPYRITFDLFDGSRTIVEFSDHKGPVKV